MIVYIASYPRSGNSAIAQLLVQAFKQSVSSVYGERQKQHDFTAHWRFPGEYDIKAIEGDYLWNEWIAVYDRVAPGPEVNTRILVNGCLALMTPINRRRLAAEDTIFFLKTHELPFDSYFSGEYVIQPVRNPGPCLRSSFHLLKQEYNQQLVTVEKTIRGETLFGSWSTYHSQWCAAAANLGDRYLSFTFDVLIQDPYLIRDQVANFLSLPVMDDQYPIRSKESLLRQSRKVYASNQDWENFYTKKQLLYLWQQHADMMTKFGFTEPDYMKARGEDSLGQKVLITVKHLVTYGKRWLRRARKKLLRKVMLGE